MGVSKGKKQRLRQIYQMLLEMASGNFFYRLKRSKKSGSLEALVVTLNMLAEEIEGAMMHQGYANTDTVLLNIIQMNFLIDGAGLIQMTNRQTCNILSISHNDIQGKPFDSILTVHSRNLWKQTWSLLLEKAFYDTALVLEFKAKAGLTIPKTCYVTTFEDRSTKKRLTQITAIHHSDSQNELDSALRKTVLEHSNKSGAGSVSPTEPPKPRFKLSFEDIRKIRNGHDYIINHLEMDFPSLKDFALQLGTNEFKLKYGFKELYGTTVYRFLTRERLRKAKMMILHSDQSLKSIAHMCGFKSVPHFSKTFKKHYGYTPSDLRKTGNQDGFE